MRLIFSIALFALLATALGTQQAAALPAFRTEFEDYYVKKMNNAEFTSAFTEAKCNVCHYGTKKTNHNDYGKALQQFLKKDNYKFTRLKAEPEAVKKEITDAFKKVEEMKSISGKSFGELLKAGELPGTAPEGEDTAAK